MATAHTKTHALDNELEDASSNSKASSTMMRQIVRQGAQRMQLPSSLLAHHSDSRCLSTAAAAAGAGPVSSSTSAQPLHLGSSLQLRSGHRMPMLGLGTWRADPGQVGSSVASALQLGYRNIDSAAVYENEAELGQAINQYISSSGEKRDSLFITSKLWNTFHAPEDVEPALRRSLQLLGLSYVDLYLVHWPVCFARTRDPTSGAEVLYPRDQSGQLLFPESDVPLARTWEAMVGLKRAGLARDIGVSNCTSAQVAALVEEFGAADGPSVNQVEIHPFCPQHAMQRELRPLGVHLTAYSPLGNIHAAPPSAGIKPSASAKARPPPPPSPLVHPTVVSIAQQRGATPAQVLLRWNLQLGRAVLPKSVRPARLQENASLFHFELTDSDMEQIAKLGEPATQHRFLNPPFTRVPHKPFFTGMEA